MGCCEWRFRSECNPTLTLCSVTLHLKRLLLRCLSWEQEVSFTSSSCQVTDKPRLCSSYTCMQAYRLTQTLQLVCTISEICWPITRAAAPFSLLAGPVVSLNGSKGLSQLVSFYFMVIAEFCVPLALLQGCCTPRPTTPSVARRNASTFFKSRCRPGLCCSGDSHKGGWRKRKAWRHSAAPWGNEEAEVVRAESLRKGRRFGPK